MAKQAAEHPGPMLRRMYLEPLSISVTELAARIGVGRVGLSRVLNGRAAVSPNLAIRLGMAFASEPEFWLQAQVRFDLQQARKSARRLNIARVA